LKRTYEEINAKIQRGDAVVMTAEEAKEYGIIDEVMYQPKRLKK